MKAKEYERRYQRKMRLEEIKFNIQIALECVAFVILAVLFCAIVFSCACLIYALYC